MTGDYFVKISSMLETPSVRILLFILAKDEVRYTDLANLFTSRGTLSSNLKELEEEKLIQRRVITSKPIQAYYSLTEKGVEIAKRLSEIRKNLT